MHRFLRLMSVFLFVGIILAGPVYAVTKSDDKVTLRSGETINDDYFVAGDEVTIEGTVNGDLYVAASSIRVSGVINGDIIGIAETIDITGDIRDDVRVAGGNINLTGATIGDSVSIAGDKLVIDSDTSILGGLVYGGSSLTLSGNIGRGVVGGSDSSRIDGLVSKTVQVSVTELTIDNNAVIQGDLKYSSDNEAAINGQILGEVSRSAGSDLGLDDIFKSFATGYNVWAFISALVVALVMLLLFPSMFKSAHKNLVKNPWRVARKGVIALILAVPLTGLLAVTIVGIPLALVIIACWLIAIYLAKFYVAYSLGSTMLAKLKPQKDKKTATYMALVIGIALYYVARMIPVIGWPVRFIVAAVGMGMMISLYSRPKSTGKSKA